MGKPHKRDVRVATNSIHSFDPKNGIAVLKIAEGNAPEGSVSIVYIYLWREWDLKANKEIKTIRLSSPFDPFEKSSIPWPSTNNSERLRTNSVAFNDATNTRGS